LAGPEEHNPARPAAGVRLCGLSEIAEPGARGFRFRVESRLFAGFVVRSGGALAGYVDHCPHAGWPLASFGDNYLTRSGGHILCGGHGGLFTLDGKGATSPCLGEHLTPWPVAVRDGEIYTA
jgi:nitrite reductase/ring-hydroxylating ferredoxin subunit